MASKLKSTITQQEIDNSNRFRGFVNWTDIKSPNIRNQIYLMNKTGIDANNILNQRIQAKANELANTNILDYSNQYNNLPNDLKPYFQTPQSLANTPEYQKAAAQQQQFSIDYRNYSDYQIGRQMAARGGGNVFALTNDTMRQGYTDFLNNIDAWNNYKQAQFLGQGFNAYGQPVVRNEFGTWSPVDVNGNIINVSTTGPVVPASIVVNRPIVPVNTYTGPVATIDQNKLNEALKNGITMQEFMDYGKGYNLNNNYIGSAQWWNDFNRLNRVYQPSSLQIQQGEQDISWLKELGKGAWEVTGKPFLIDTPKGTIKLGAYIGDYGYNLLTGKKGVGGLPDYMDYNKTLPFYLDTDVQTAALTSAMLGIGASSKLGADLMKYLWYGGTGYSGYKLLENPNFENLGQLGGTASMPYLFNKLGNTFGALNVKFDKYDIKGYDPKSIPSKYRIEFKDLAKSIKYIMSWKPKSIKLNYFKPTSVKGNYRLANVIKEGIQGSKDVVGGSGGINAGTNMKVVNDWDLYSNNKKASIKYWENHFNNNKIKYNHPVDEKGNIENNVFQVNGNKVLDINDMELLLNTQRTINSRLKVPSILKSVDGVKVADPRYLVVRKLLGGFQYSKVKGPLARYSKDVPRYIQAAQSILNKQLYNIPDYPIYKQYQQFQIGRAKEYLNRFNRMGSLDKVQPQENRYIDKRPNWLIAGKDYVKFDNLMPKGKRGSFDYNNDIIMKNNKYPFAFYYNIRNNYSNSNVPYVNSNLVNKNINNVIGNPSNVDYPGINPPDTKYPVINPPIIPSGFRYGFSSYQYKDDKNNRKRDLNIKEENMIGFQPVFITSKGKTVRGNIYPNTQEAIAEGMEVSDKTSFKKFTIKKVIGNRLLMKRHPGTDKGYKFIQKGNIYIEKAPYKNSKTKSSFDLRPYVYG